jgi:hypothetical protein
MSLMYFIIFGMLEINRILETLDFKFFGYATGNGDILQ